MRSALCHPERKHHAKGLCHRCYAKKRWQTPELRNQDKVRARNFQLKDRYGISLEEYSALKEFQGGVCAICKLVPRGRWGPAFYVDHNHATGKVRGLLCSKCNTGLGLFNDSSKLLLEAVNYLSK